MYTMNVNILSTEPFSILVKEKYKLFPLKIKLGNLRQEGFSFINTYCFISILLKNSVNRGKNKCTCNIFKARCLLFSAHLQEPVYMPNM